MLKTRLITGIILIGLILAVIFLLPVQGFAAVVGLLGFGMMCEWVNLSGLTNRLARILILDVFVVLEFILYWCHPNYTYLFWAGAVFWTSVIFLLIFAQAKNHIPKFNLSFSLLIGFFTLLLLFSSLLTLRSREQGEYLVLMSFLIVWCSDSFAYVTGRLLGKHKLIPLVSPGKSIEGVIGAFLLTLPVLGLYWMKVMGHPIPNAIWALGLVFLILMGVVGDLFESLIKRMHQVKDSGTLLPGHGGLLDRFDSLMAVAPLLALFIVLGVL